MSHSDYLTEILNLLLSRYKIRELKKEWEERIFNRQS